MYNWNKNNKVEPKITGEINTSYKNDKIKNQNDSILLRKYLHDIRNIKLLDKEMINNIRNMSNEEKMDIIITLNNVVENLKSFIE
jgi:hypothetical protein